MFKRAQKATHTAAKEVLAVALDELTCKFLENQGVPPESAKFMSKIPSATLKGISEGLSIVNVKSVRQQLADALRDSMIIASTTEEFEMYDEVRSALLDIFTTENAISFLNMGNDLRKTEIYIRKILEKFDQCDLETLPIEDISTNVLASLKQEIEDNPDLTGLKAYLNTEKIFEKLDEVAEDVLATKQISSKNFQLSQEILHEVMKNNQIPDKSKRVISLPHRNLYFAGRTEELKNIAEAFKQYNTVALIGAGGFGKSQIAYEYAHDHEKEYDYIWVINAGNNSSLENDYRNLAVRLRLLENLPNEKLDFRTVILPNLQEWFDNNDRFLLIYENTEEAASLQNYLPSSIARGHVLLTTRDVQQPITATEILIDVFSEIEAVAFLKNRLNLKKQKSGISDDDTKRLGKMLGFLPLALEQASAYIINNKVSIPSYIELFKNYTHKTLDYQGRNADYAKTVLTTWNISIEKINSEEAKQLFNICAYFASEAIPLQIFIDNREQLPAPLHDQLEGEWDINELIEELTRYSLISSEKNNSLLFMHRLIQEVVRYYLDEDVQWLYRALDTIFNAFDFDYGDKETFNIILPHALEIASHAEEIKDVQEKIGQIYSLAGHGLYNLGQYPKALEWYHEALKISERILGVKHPITAITYNNIATIYYNQGNYTKALTWCHKVIDIQEQILEKDHSIIATAYNIKALVYYNLNEYIIALEWYYKALNIQKKVLGKNHPDTAMTYNNIAAVYYNQRNYIKSLAWYREAKSIQEKILGKDHPDTAMTYNNIAAVYYSLKNNINALEWYREAKGIQEKILGKDHPDTAMTYNNIAAVYESQKDYTKALKWYHKALEIQKKILGVKHPATTVTYKNIAGVYERQGDYPKALDWCRKALNTEENTLGNDHPHTAIILD